MGELLRLFLLIPLFVIMIIIIVIIIIMVVGRWCNAGVTRKREDPHNHLGGWWGQPANRNETGHNKTTGASRGFGLPHALPPEHKLNKLTSTRPRQRSQHSARRGGRRGKDADACLPACGTEPTTYSDCLLCPLTLQTTPRPALEMMSPKSKGNAALGSHETQTS